MKRVTGPGSRRRYNDKICGHQEKANENDQEFHSIMMELQRDIKTKTVQVGKILSYIVVRIVYKLRQRLLY